MLYPRVKLLHLRTFVEVTRRGSVGQAAEVLAVTQPAVPRTFKELKTIVGGANPIFWTSHATGSSTLRSAVSVHPTA